MVEQQSLQGFSANKKTAWNQEVCVESGSVIKVLVIILEQPLTSLIEVAALDAQYKLAASRDWEVKVAFLRLAISSGCKEYFGAVEKALKQVGRMKYLRPLYNALVQGTAEEEMLAKRIFVEACDCYHPIAQGVVKAILSQHT